MPLKGLGNVKLAIGDLKESANDNVRAVYFTGLRAIVEQTPVDEGRARNNWFLTSRQPSTQKRGKNKAGTASLKSVSTMSKNVLNKTFYFTNNLPYIHVLEYGGYPTPVKKGTYNKRTKTFEIRSINGFSDQVAPKGWVRSVVIRMQNAIRKL